MHKEIVELQANYGLLNHNGYPIQQVSNLVNCKTQTDGKAYFVCKNVNNVRKHYILLNLTVADEHKSFYESITDSISHYPLRTMKDRDFIPVHQKVRQVKLGARKFPPTQ